MKQAYLGSSILKNTHFADKVKLSFAYSFSENETRQQILFESNSEVAAYSFSNEATTF